MTPDAIDRTLMPIAPLAGTVFTPDGLAASRWPSDSHLQQLRPVVSTVHAK